MVLEEGRLAEMDTPDALVAKEGGIFAGLWERHKLSEGENH